MSTTVRAWLLQNAALPLFLTIAGGLVAAGFAAQESPDWQYKLLVLNWQQIPAPIKAKVRDAMREGRMRRWDFSAINRDLEDSPIAIVLNDPKGTITDPRGDLSRLVDGDQALRGGR